jgi:predicted dehydrogenase
MSAGREGRIRVAVVGAGGWGAEHLRIFASRPDTDLVAVVARTPQTAQRRAAEFATTGYTDLDEMMAQTRPDLVTTSLPNEGHFEPTRRLLTYGTPMLVEKPLVFDVDEAQTLLDEAGDLFFAINFNHRYATAVQRAKRAIDGGELGDVVHVSWRFGGEANPGQSPYRNLFETQCHGFDMLEHLGGPIASVMAQMSNRTDPDAFHTMAISVSFASGAVGSLLGSYDTSYAYPDAQRIEVNGTAGLALIEDTVQRLTLATAGDETRRVWTPGYFNDTDRTFTHTFDRHVDALLHALRAGDPPPVPARAGARAVQLAAASVRSFQDGVRVAV